ncbi:MAG: substrate-binding domain-containing protein, partial [Pseudomonadota bacterium]
MKWLTILVVCLLASAAPADRLRLAVTTSFENSGLADVLLPAYEAATGARIDLVIAGTGRALRLGAAGDVDAVLTHAPEAEAVAVAAGDYLYRRPVMYNDFVLIGPSTDPAALTE